VTNRRSDVTKVELHEFRVYVETNKRVGDVVATDEWIEASFRRLHGHTEEVTVLLNDAREQFAKWREDYDRLLELEIDLKKRVNGQGAVACSELREILSPS